MLFPQLTNTRLSLGVLPPSLLHIHMHVERKGENQGKKAPLRPQEPSALRRVMHVHANFLYVHLEEGF